MNDPLIGRVLRRLMAAVVLGAVGLAQGAEAPAYFSLAKLRLEPTRRGYEMRHADGALPSVELFLDGGTPRLISCEVAKQDGRIGLITYYAGSAGTSQFYKVTRVVVVDLVAKRILGIVLQAYTPESNEPPLRQPEWKWSKNRLVVIDREFGGATTLTW